MRRPAAFPAAAAALLAGLAASIAPSARGAEPTPAHPRYDLAVTVDPAAHHLAVEATLTLPAAPQGGTVDVLLNGALSVTRSTPAAEEVPAGDVGAFLGNNGTSDALGAAVALKRYRFRVGTGTTVSLAYGGRFDFGLSDPKEEYTRGFRETAGIVSPEGVYLSGAGFWVPQLPAGDGGGLLEFRMTAKVPAGWELISQGDGTSRGADGVARWDSKGAVDEVYLVGGPLVVSRDAAGAVTTLVYLRKPDEALAARYLGVAAQYLEMYRGLIGPYPYGKFALVENFWETGYGMASFTLLGPQVIRFPFILHSSFPHEILHNWWGNSVFVAYEKGNWCEGLTAYLADHLVQEQRGKGEEYRRTTLQKYRDYVKAGRDFPLTEFRSRHSAATEAVGYGKALMLFHMVRREVGDDAFRRTLARFYREERGRRATWGDFRRTAEAVGGRDLGWLFDGFVARTGAPALAVSGVSAKKAEGGWTVTGTLEQTQGEAPFVVDVPVAVRTAREVVTTSVRLQGRTTAFSVTSADEPLLVSVDPGFDVFRRLDPRETPPSLGQVFGDPKVLALLPSSAAPAEQEAWRKLAEGWASESQAVEVRVDSDVRSLPSDRSVWVLGRGNRFANEVLAARGDVSLKGEALAVAGEAMPLAGHCGTVVARHPADASKAVGWIFASDLAALPGLGRKLPHYGKYSALGFEGTEPTNVLKAVGPESDSPLRVDLRAPGTRGAPLPPVAEAPRKALAELPPAFSQKELLAHVAFLAAPERDGRGLGSAGLAAAAEYVAARMKEAGLAPGGDGGTYFQKLVAPRGPSGFPVETANVVGILRGTKREWSDQAVIVSSHYDHLGRGWPDVHAGDEGKVHPGADDDASGVAVMLELAKAMAAGEKPLRSIVFVAFTGEEAGRLGSKRFAGGPSPVRMDQVEGVINLDTVGRLGNGPITVLGTGTTTEWQHIFRGASFVTGIESRNVPEPLESSDHVSFLEKGVPAVQLFTGAHADYHRPGDTADKVDGPGLVKVATFAKEAVAYLAERPEPLTRTDVLTKLAARGDAPAPPAGAPAAPGTGVAPRRVSFGTVPDFAFAGPGVKVDGLVPGSPAEKAGVKPGDVLVKLDGAEVKDLRAFSDRLKALTPGRTVSATLLRDGKEVVLPVTVEGR